MEKEQADQILAALPWRCFQCDFVTSDPEEASAHFGDRDDGEEFKPICKWWDGMDDGERKHTFQELQCDLNRGAEENMRLLTRIDGLEYEVSCQEERITSYKPFKNCRSIYDIFCVYDSLEGRLLAAQERERVLVEAVNDAGFKVMLSDDGKTFLKRDLPTISVPASCWPGNEPLA